MQWSGVAQRRRDAAIYGMRRGGGHNNNAMRHDAATRTHDDCAIFMYGRSVYYSWDRLPIIKNAESNGNPDERGCAAWRVQQQRNASSHGMRLDVCTTITQCVITTRRARPGIATQCPRNRARRPPCGGVRRLRDFLYMDDRYIIHAIDYQ